MNLRKTRTALLTIFALPMLVAVPLAAATESAPCGPGMSGGAKTIVHYAPGPNIAEAGQVMPKHLLFLQAQMSNGALQYAGPMIAGGAPTGRAVLIYHSADAAAVQAIVQTDPMVIAKVFGFEVGTWLECKSSATAGT